MKPGAKWCISMQTSNEHWDRYSPDIHFFFWFRDDNSLGDNRKIAIGVSKSTWKVALIYNGADNKIYEELPSYIKEAINKEKDGYKEKEINRLKSKLKLNSQTNRYDYDGDLSKNDLSNFIAENKEGFTINFGKVTGSFDCPNLELTSLKGAPQKVGRDFYCYNNNLRSLEGAPQEVGRDFDCSWNKLTSLEGAPNEIRGSFDCRYNPNLYSLDGIGKVKGRIIKDF